MAYSVLPTVSAGETISSTDWGNVVKANIEALKDPPSHLIERNNGALYSTTSTTLVAVDATNFQCSLTTTGGDVWVHVQATIHADSTSGRNARFDLSVDGGAAHYSGQGYAGSYQAVAVLSTSCQLLCLDFLIEGLPAGVHTFALMWVIGTGTLYMHADTDDASTLNEQPATMWAREVS